MLVLLGLVMEGFGFGLLRGLTLGRTAGLFDSKGQGAGKGMDSNGMFVHM